MRKTGWLWLLLAGMLPGGAAELSFDRGPEAANEAPVFFRVGQSAPVLDGVWQAGEYALEASGFFQLQSRQYAATQARYGLSADAKCLYLAISSPVATPLKTTIAAPDGNVWEDDAIEVYLVGNFGAGDRYQWIVNADGVVYDSKNGNPAWNAPEVRWQSRVADGVWTVEAAIPWRAVGGAQPWWRFNLGRSYVGIPEFTSVSPSRIMYGDIPTMAVLHPDAAAPRLQLTGPGELGARRLQLTMTLPETPAGNYTFRAQTDNRVLPFVAEETLAAASGETLQFTAATDAGRPLPESAALKLEAFAGTDQLLFRTTLPYQESVPFKVAYWYSESKNDVLHVVVRPQPFSPGGNLAIGLADPEGSDPVTRSFAVPAQTGEVTLDFDLAGFPAGDYRLLLTGRDNQGNVFLDTWELFAKYPEKTPWQDFAGGIGYDAPAPWQPLAWDGSTLTLWNRHYRFGAALLPEQLQSADNELLTAPIRLLRDGSVMEFSAAGNGIAEAAPGTGCKQLTAVNRSGDLELTTRLQAAFDGLLEYELELAPAQPGKTVTVHALALEIPLSRRYATGYDNNQSLLSKTDLSLLPSGTEIPANLTQTPILWIGDAETGTMLGVENLRGWHCRDENRSAILTLDDTTATLRLQLADEAFELREPRRIRFQLQATPVKPLNHLAKRQYDVSGSFGAGSPLAEVSPNGLIMWSGYWQQFYGLADLRFLNEPMLAEFARTKRENNTRVAHYFGGYSTSPFSPAWAAFGLQWHSPPPKFGENSTDAVIADRAGRNANVVVSGCFNDADYRNFQLKNFADVLGDDRVGAEDLYFDFAWPKSCANELHGCAYTDDFGRPRMTTSLSGTREYYERVYRLLHGKTPDGLIAAHVISMKSPTYSFFDFLVCGEAYDTLIVRSDNYYDVFTPELLRIAYTPLVADYCVWVLPQFTRAHLLFAPEKSASWSPDAPESVRAIRHMLGYLVVHNVDFWPSWGAQAQAWEILKALFRLDGGSGERKFYPYWQQAGPVEKVTPANSRILVSAYEHDGKLLLAVLNDTDASSEVEVKFNPVITVTGAVSLFAPATLLPVQENIMRIQLQPREFQLLELY